MDAQGIHFLFIFIFHTLILDISHKTLQTYIKNTIPAIEQYNSFAVLLRIEKDFRRQINLILGPNKKE